MTELSGALLLGNRQVMGTGNAFHAVDPVTRQSLEPEFREAGVEQIAEAARIAEKAFQTYSTFAPDQRAAFLRAIADELLALGAPLLERAQAETALPMPRLVLERGRTMLQLRLMADVLHEGSWVEARIDTGDPTRTPVPKPDLRRLLVPLGPVAVFAASNFPFAYSVAGGDTASALATGCTVVCKAHPAHPGTSELTASAIHRAAARTGVPDGVFSLLQGWSHEVGLALVNDPHMQAVGFTGSLRGGRAIFNAAAARPQPIPVYAEMGSVNPVFLLPSAVRDRGAAIAKGLANSVTQGVGQFCTNPGVIVGVESHELRELVESLAGYIRNSGSGTMLYEGLFRNFTSAVEHAQNMGASTLAHATDSGNAALAHPVLLATDAQRFINEPGLRAEMFGPVSMVVTGQSMTELEQVASTMEGQLTASIHGTEAELAEHVRLVRLLQRKVGRLIFNGYPTGVEVGHAIQHGGPYPASTDSRTTSVGSASIARFARPVCFQNFPDSALPQELRNANVRGLWRTINGAFTKADVQ